MRVHIGIARGHFYGETMTKKILCLGAMEYVKHCDMCQRKKLSTANDSISIMVARVLAKWSIDFVNSIKPPT